uniref:DUF5666 domain-containing protein n=1 Tax=Magnetococcus massalia (strain MO-1) TaxID=451514 RepID=A0A1S7LH02_MAGMO|nr:Exported protein of unknown function [Candidatus Magnetococcus massalia]
MRAVWPHRALGALLSLLLALLAGCTLQEFRHQSDAEYYGQRAERGIGGTGKQHAERGIGGSGVIETAERGIGGTGRELAERGIGGTGLIQTADRGMGGTGKTVAEGGIGGTGIIGTVSAFGSIWVNGAHVHYNQGTAFAEDGATTDYQRLRLGQLVMVEAREEGGRLVASSVAIHHAVIGPVTAVDGENQQLEVLGQRVTLGSTQLAEGAGLKVGQWLSVSGLRDGSGAIVASRLERLPPQPEALLHLPLQQLSAATSDVRLPVEMQQEVQQQVTTGTLRLRGPVRQQQLVVARWQSLPSRPFGGRVTRYILEGYPAAAGQLRSGPYTVPMTKQPKVMQGRAHEGGAQHQRLLLEWQGDTNSQGSAAPIKLQHQPMPQFAPGTLQWAPEPPLSLPTAPAGGASGQPQSHHPKGEPVGASAPEPAAPTTAVPPLLPMQQQPAGSPVQPMETLQRPEKLQRPQLWQGQPGGTKWRPHKPRFERSAIKSGSSGGPLLPVPSPPNPSPPTPAPTPPLHSAPVPLSPGVP